MLRIINQIGLIDHLALSWGWVKLSGVSSGASSDMPQGRYLDVSALGTNVAVVNSILSLDNTLM